MERPLTENIRRGQEPLDIEAYEKAGGYRALRKALQTMTPKEVTKVVDDSHLRGRGGAGFPTGHKWALVTPVEGSLHPRYMIANADEMEPGTFKDRMLLEGNPHQVIEGLVIASYAVQADIAYIFLRKAYGTAARRVSRAISEAYDRGYVGRNILGTDFSTELYLHTSAGRYICGEETALLNALEGRRAVPRTKPPYPPAVGLWGKPTTANNVETISNVPHIIEHGADWFRQLSHSVDGGTKIYGVSGRVRTPGAWELPMGTTIREVFDQHAGGMRDGVKFRALIPGGASTEFLNESHLDVKMDFDSMQAAGSRLGTGTMIVLDDITCPVGMVLNLMRFFAQESCGWCTPCREGLPWLTRILDAIENGQGEPKDMELLERHTHLLAFGNTFCALAPGAMEPLQSALKLFEEDFLRHIHDKRCPWR